MWAVKWTDGNGRKIFFGNNRKKPYTRFGDAANLAQQLSWFYGSAQPVLHKGTMRLKAYQYSKRKKR